MPRAWTLEQIAELTRGYQPACVLAAAAELDVFEALAAGPRTAAQLADRLHADLRGLTILLDALAAMQLLEKRGDQYAPATGTLELLTVGGSQTILAMTRHQAACLRRWSRLAEIIKTGRPLERSPGIRGAEAETASFIEAMDNVSRSVAPGVVADLRAIAFTHLLDVGGASGTWTIAFLKAHPRARATLFDLPPVIPMARRRLTDAGLIDRVQLVGGDYHADALPPGADLAWLSAIAHQNSRAQNRALFARTFTALAPGGTVLLRDMVMDEGRTQPVAGALFAVNMLAGTEAGGTFTFAEYRADLEAAGFANVRIARPAPDMSCVIAAGKPS